MPLDWGIPQTSSRGCLFQEPPRAEGVSHKAHGEISFSFFLYAPGITGKKWKNRGDNFEKWIALFASFSEMPCNL